MPRKRNDKRERERERGGGGGGGGNDGQRKKLACHSQIRTIAMQESNYEQARVSKKMKKEREREKEGQ